MVLKAVKIQWLTAKPLFVINKRLPGSPQSFNSAQVIRITLFIQATQHKTKSPLRTITI